MQKSHLWGLPLVCVLLVAANLRLPTSMASALTPLIIIDLDMSSTVGGLITTVPVISFAIVPMLSVWLVQKLDIVRAMIVGLLLVVAGEVLRSAGATSSLLSGLAVIGVGITIANVMLPVYVKVTFPKHIDVVTSLYIAMLTIASGIGAGIALPLALNEPLGWRGMLFFNLVVSVPALLAWLWLYRRAGRPAKREGKNQTAYRLVMRSSMSWMLALYWGLECFIAFSVLGWLPSIALSKGFSTETAGVAIFINAIIGLLGSIPAPMFLQRTRHELALTLLYPLILLGGIVALKVATTAPVLFLGGAMVGSGAGGMFAVAMYLINAKTSTPLYAASLSAMVQSVVYLLAAAGPVLTGMIFDMTASWDTVLLFHLGAAVLMCMTSFFIRGKREII